MALIHELFRLLDRDDDGALSAEELFVFALAVAHIVPEISLPPLVDSPTSPGWLQLYRDLAAGHAAPAIGFDRCAFGRLVTRGRGEDFGGMALSSNALSDILAHLAAH
jgi:hypothetical protein